MAKPKLSRWESDDDMTMKFGRSSLFSLDSSTEASTSLRGFLRNILESQRFDLVMGAVVILNSCTIGIEQSIRLEGGDRRVVDTLEHCFLTIYVVELVMNLIVRRWRSIESPWIRFDIMLVSVSVFTQWIWVPIHGHLDGVGLIMVLRTARLLRLARTLRLLLRFKELWMLAQGLISSASTMVYTTFLLVVILYIFGCIAVEMITLNPKAIGPDADENFQALVAEYFPSLGGAMLTLLAFVSFDNIVTIYKPLINLDWMLLPYFTLLILVVGIVLANLVTAVIVNSALEQAQQDKALVKTVEAAKKKKVVKDLRKIFQRLDTDGSGKVSTEEIQEVEQEDLARLAEFMAIQDPVEIFNALDVDESGEIDIDEFCDGIWEVVISEAPLEMKRMEKQVENMQTVVKQIQQNQSLMQDQLGDILQLLQHRGSSDSGCIRAGLQHAQSSFATQDVPHMTTSQVSQGSVDSHQLDVKLSDNLAADFMMSTHRFSPAVVKVLVEPTGLGSQQSGDPPLSVKGLVAEARAGGKQRREKEALCSADCSSGEHRSAGIDPPDAGTMDLASYVDLKVLNSLTSCRELDVLLELCDARVHAALSRSLEKLQSTGLSSLQSPEDSGKCAVEFRSMLQRALANVIPAEGHDEGPVASHVRGLATRNMGWLLQGDDQCCHEYV